MPTRCVLHASCLHARESIPFNKGSVKECGIVGLGKIKSGGQDYPKWWYELAYMPKVSYIIESVVDHTGVDRENLEASIKLKGKDMRLTVQMKAQKCETLASI